VLSPTPAEAKTVTFTPTDWNLPQTVTVTGIDDLEDDGNVTYTIAGTASGGGYDGKSFSVSVTNIDDEEPTITVTPTTGLVTTEAAGEPGPNTFTILLNVAPTDTVTIVLTSSDDSEGKISTVLSPTPAATKTVTFTTTNWSLPQTVTVTGVDDDVLDGDVAYTIITQPASGGNYTGVNAADVSVTNLDDEFDIESAITVIKTKIDAIEAKLDMHGTFYTFVDNWFTTIKTAVDAIKAKTDTIVWGDITTIKSEVTSTDHGLAAIKTAVDAIPGGGGGVSSAADTDVSIARNAAAVIVPQGSQAFWGQLTVQSTAAGYNIEVYDGDSWLAVVPSGGKAQSSQVSGFGLRIYNDTSAATITVDYVFVYHLAP
jgi:hypothetical protein